MSIASPNDGPLTSRPGDSLRLTNLDDDGEMELVLSSGCLYRAGQCPEPGLYREVDGGRRSVEITTQGEPLPPSFDGRVALYRRIERLWGQIEQQHTTTAAAA